MKYIYKNESVTLSKKSPKDFKEVVFSYEVNGAPIKKFYFLSDDTSAAALAHAKRIIEAEKENGKLDKYTKTYLRKMKFTPNKRKALFITGAAVLVAGIAVGATFLTLSLLNRESWAPISDKRALEILENIDKKQGWDGTKYTDHTLFDLVEANGHSGKISIEMKGDMNTPNDDDDTDEINAAIKFNLNTKKEIFYLDTPSDMSDFDDTLRSYVAYRRDDKVSEKGLYMFEETEAGKDPVCVTNQPCEDFDEVREWFDEEIYGKEEAKGLRFADVVFGRIPISDSITLYSLMTGVATDRESVEKLIDELLEEEKAIFTDYSLRFTSCNKNSIALTINLTGTNPQTKKAMNMTGKVAIANSLLKEVSLEVPNLAKMKIAIDFGSIKMANYTKWDTKVKVEKLDYNF